MNDIRDYILNIVDLTYLEPYLKCVKFNDEVLTLTIEMKANNFYANLLADELTTECKEKLKPYFSNIKVIVVKPPSDKLIKEYWGINCG